MRKALPILTNQVTALLLGLVALKLLSRYVPPAVNGAYALFLTLSQLGTLLTHAGLMNHASRSWQREQNQHSAYLRFLWETSLLNLKYLVVSLIAACGILFYQTRQTGWIWALPLLLAGNFALVLTEIGVMVTNAAERHWAVCVLRLATGTSRLFLPLLFAIGFGASLLNLSLGFAVHGFLVVLTGILLVHRFAPAPVAFDGVTRRWRQELRDYGRPFILMGAGGWLLLNADRWVVVKFFGAEQGGHFALAASLGAIPPTFVCSLLMQRFFPVIFRRADHANHFEDWRSLSRLCDLVTLLLLSLSLIGLVALHFVGPSLIGWMIDARYQPAMGMVLAAGLSALTVQANQFQYLLLQGQHDSMGMVKVMAVVAGVKTAGSVLGAMISWEFFLGWLMVSSFLCTLLGRYAIRSMALKTASKRDLDGPRVVPLGSTVSEP